MGMLSLSDENVSIPEIELREKITKLGDTPKMCIHERNPRTVAQSDCSAETAPAVKLNQPHQPPYQAFVCSLGCL